MSLYFSNKLYGDNRLDAVLDERTRVSKIVSETERRQNISKAERGKTRKRKPKSKGKHRKGKKVKSGGEITITNDPTQKVSGYSVVNVISAKRGPYKKQQPIGPPGSTKAKGGFGRSGAVRGGLVAGQSDNQIFRDAAFGDGGNREELRGLRRQVDRIEQRLNGVGLNPAQQNQQGPLNVPAQPANAPANVAAGGGVAPNVVGLGQNNLAQPPPQRARVIGRRPAPRARPAPQSPRGPPPIPASLSGGSQGSVDSVRTTASEKELARELGVEVGVVRNISDAKFIELLEETQRRSRVPRRDTDRQLLDLERLLGNPQPTPAEQAAAAVGRRLNQPHNQRIRGTTPSARSESSFGSEIGLRPSTPPRLNLNPSSFTPEELRRMRSGGSVEEAAPSEQSLRLSVRSSQRSFAERVEEDVPTVRKPRPRSPRATPRSEAALQQFLDRQRRAGSPVGEGQSIARGVAARIARQGGTTGRSEAVSVPSTPLQIGEQALEDATKFISPRDAGREVGQSPETASRGLGVSSALDSMRAAMAAAAEEAAKPPAAEGSIIKQSPRVTAPTGQAVARAQPASVPRAAVVSRYGDYKPSTTPRDVVGKQIGGKGRGRGGPARYIGGDTEYQRLETRKSAISTQLYRDKLLPDTAFLYAGGKLAIQRKGREVMLEKHLSAYVKPENVMKNQTKFLGGQIVKYWDENNVDDNRRLFVIDRMIDFAKSDEDLGKRQKELRKAATGFSTKAGEELAKKKAARKPSVDTIYEQPENPAIAGGGGGAMPSEEFKQLEAQLALGSSGVLVPKTEEIPLPTNVNPDSSGVGAAASAAAGAVVGGAASLAGGIVSGAASAIASQLPTAGQVGNVIGQGAVIGAGALVRGGAGAISGGYQMIANDPLITGQPEAEI